MCKLAENECQELKETIQYLEHELLKSKEQISNLSNKLNQTQDEISRCHNQISKQASLSHNQIEEIEQLKRQVKEYSKRPSEQNVEDRIKKYQQEIEMKEEEIKILKKEYSEKEGETMSSSMTQDQCKIKLEALQNEIGAKERENADLIAKVKETTEKLEALQLGCKSEGIAMLEIECLKEDNAKLVDFLKQTKEFKEFAEFFEDSGGAIRIKTGSMSARDKKDNSSQNEWVPKEVMKINLVNRLSILGKILR